MTAEIKGFFGFVRVLAIDTETVARELLVKGASHIGEGEFGCGLRGVASQRGLLLVRRIDPGDGSGRHAEVQVIDGRIRVAGLGVGASDLLLDLAKAGLNTPSLKPLWKNF
jgi:hypothetical protein